MNALHYVEYATWELIFLITTLLVSAGLIFFIGYNVGYRSAKKEK